MVQLCRHGRSAANIVEDMIIRGGMNIAAAAVEAVIAEGTSLDVSGVAREVNTQSD